MLFLVFGFSINTLSMLGLVLAIGLVVDHAIVVVELGGISQFQVKGMNQLWVAAQKSCCPSKSLLR